MAVTLPGGSLGNAEGKVFAQFRFGQGNGVGLRPAFTSTVNSTAFETGAGHDDSFAILAQAWYQMNVPLPLDGFKAHSRQRLEVNVGKMDPFVFFDQNVAADDETMRFMNNALVHNPLLDSGGDAGVDAYGFTPGVRLAYVSESDRALPWSASVGVFGSGPAANFSGSLGKPFVIAQLDTTRRFFTGLVGNHRLYAWHNGRASDFSGAPAGHTGWGASIDCAPLLDLRHLTSASDCHACGRCSGHRGAIALTLRSPNQEILQGSAHATDPYPARLLVFGLLGPAPGAFQWSASLWFVGLRQGAAQWLVAHGHDALLSDDLPWWLLTHHPTAGDVFNGLDGLAILAYLAASTMVLGGSTWLALRAAARLCGAARLRWHTLASALIPLAGTSLFLGLSMMTLTQLRPEGIRFAWVGPVRALLLGGGMAWSAWLAARLLAGTGASLPRRALAWLLLAMPLVAIGSSWVLVFYRW